MITPLTLRRIPHILKEAVIIRDVLDAGIWLRNCAVCRTGISILLIMFHPQDSDWPSNAFPVKTAINS